jgi:hypothetical protein
MLIKPEHAINIASKVNVLTNGTEFVRLTCMVVKEFIQEIIAKHISRISILPDLLQHWNSLF